MQVYEHAARYAEQHNITGVTYRLTQGVIKNIIPAVASTNSIIAGVSTLWFVSSIKSTPFAAFCALEAFKLATSYTNNLMNHMNFNASTGVYAATVNLVRNEDCFTCARTVTPIAVGEALTLQQLVDMLREQE